MIFEIGVCGAAAFLFGRGIYHSGVLSGWIVQGLRGVEWFPDGGQKIIGRPMPRPTTDLQTVAPWTDEDAKREMMLFLATGETCWWLDPNRWGDNPNWRDDIPRLTIPLVYGETRIEQPTPQCPVCGPAGQVAVMTVHGGEATMWDCMKCGAEFTRRGETKKSRKAREARALAVKREMDALAAAEEAKRLPCGCSGDVRTRAYPTGGWDMGRYAECVTCGGTWDYAPKYEESGDPRKMHPRSGPVEWPNGNKLTVAEISPPRID